MKIRCAFVHLMGNATVELFLTCSEGGVWRWAQGLFGAHTFLRYLRLEPFPGDQLFDCVFICASKDHRRNGTVLRILYLFLFLKIMLV